MMRRPVGCRSRRKPKNTVDVRESVVRIAACDGNVTALSGTTHGRGRRAPSAAHPQRQEGDVPHATISECVGKSPDASAARGPPRSTRPFPVVAFRPSGPLLLLLPHANGKWQVEQAPVLRQRLPEDGVLPRHLPALHEAALPGPLQELSIRLTIPEPRRTRAPRHTADAASTKGSISPCRGRR